MMLIAGLAACLAAASAATAGCPEPFSDLILVTEMANDGTNTFVEIHNPGPVEINLTNWWVCINPDFIYNTIALDEFDALAPGGVLVLQLGGELDETHADRLILASPSDLIKGDFGLYFGEGFPDFASPDAIREYLQWGASGQIREGVGNDACLWTAGDFIPNPLNGSTFQLDGDAANGELTSAADFSVHSFALNSLRVFPPPPVTATGDADGDEDVDWYDLIAFQECDPAPDVPAGTDVCAPNFDFDGDTDIDLVDFAAFQIVFTGARVPVELTITGADQVDENSTANYSATATYTMGPADTVTDLVAWSVDIDTYASIDDATGTLTTLEVDDDETVTVQASYTFEGTEVLDTLEVTIIDETPPAEPVDGTIIITELAGDGTTTYMELFNTGDLDISLTDWWLCLNPDFKYEEIALDASDVLAGGEVLVIQLGGTLNTDLADRAVTIDPSDLDVGDIALYVGQAGLNFALPANIRDYLQWGAAGQTREDTGDEAGLWTAGTYIDASLDDGSVQLVETAVDVPLTDVDSLYAVPFSEHSLGVFPNPAPPADDDPVDEEDEPVDEGDGEDPDAPADETDPDGENPDEDPSDPIGSGGGAGDEPSDDLLDDIIPDGDNPDPAAEDEIPETPTTTGSSSSARSGLCGLFGLISLFATIAGLGLMKLTIRPRRT